MVQLGAGDSNDQTAWDGDTGKKGDFSFFSAEGYDILQTSVVITDRRRRRIRRSAGLLSRGTPNQR